MKRIFALVVAAFLFAAPLSAQTAADKPVAREMTVKQLIHTVKGGIVRIEATGPIVDGEKQYGWVSTGTGFILPGGYIVTNYHVLQPKDGTKWKERKLSGEFSLELPGTTPFTSEGPANPIRSFAGPGNFESRNWSRRTAKLVVVGEDAKSDLAVLKLAPIASAALISTVDDAIRAMRLEAYAVKFAAPGSYELGDPVVAIGFAKSIQGMPSISKGIVSGLNRSIDLHSDMVQTDAAINGGNSGGPLFNMMGEVIGVNTCTHNGAQNISYARSSRTTAPIVAKLIADKKIVRNDLGLSVSVLYRNEVRDLRVAQGVVVSSVWPGSPADDAGIKAGDILTSINGETIESIGDFNAALAIANKGAIKVACQRLPDGEVKQVLGYLSGNGKLPNGSASLKDIAFEVTVK